MPPPRTGRMSAFHQASRQSALPLRGIRKAPPKKTQDLPRRPPATNLQAAVVISREARRQHQENVERARVAAEREKARRQAEIEAKKAEERKQQAAVQQQVPPKRPAPSPNVNSAKTETCKVVRRRAPQSQGQSNEILVWPDGNNARPSLIEVALSNGPLKPAQVPEHLARSCIADGLTIFRNDDDTFTTDGLSNDPSKRSDYWKALVQHVVVDDSQLKGKVIDVGGTGATRVGVGTFNVVVAFSDGVLPQWLPRRAVCRLTRPDCADSDDEFQYQNAVTVKRETNNLLFCALNGLGPELYSISVCSAPRPFQSPRFAQVVCMERAVCDMAKTLKNIGTFAEGALLAESCINLLAKASMLGVAFFDIKPGNILCMSDQFGGNPPDLRLTDTDPAFFLRIDKDWRALLLLNLALLGVHMYNADKGSVSRGFATTIKPALRQLIQKKDDYECDWLFRARCVEVGFEVPKNQSDFELQRLFCSVSYSYFYSHERKEFLSFGNNWTNKEKNQTTLDAYWASRANQNSWPPEWQSRDSDPLIVQLANLAIKHAN